MNQPLPSFYRVNLDFYFYSTVLTRLVPTTPTDQQAHQLAGQIVCRLGRDGRYRPRTKRPSHVSEGQRWTLPA